VALTLRSVALALRSVVLALRSMVVTLRSMAFALTSMALALRSVALALRLMALALLALLTSLIYKQTFLWQRLMLSCRSLRTCCSLPSLSCSADKLVAACYTNNHNTHLFVVHTTLSHNNHKIFFVYGIYNATNVSGTHARYQQITILKLPCVAFNQYILNTRFFCIMDNPPPL